ncbi:MAG: PIN domain-containing protein [Actinomycetota bacterium]|nr:PIN domain-containing protein [Actinomycetota bacterium]
MLLAAADRSDPDHTACRELLETHSGPLVTTALVIAESGWLIDRQLGPSAEAALYESAAGGEIRVEPLSAADWARIAALTIQYADQDLGGVDSSLIAVAERLGVSSIGTLDRRHFGVVRPQHIASFELLP